MDAPVKSRTLHRLELESTVSKHCKHTLLNTTIFLELRLKQMKSSRFDGMLNLKAFEETIVGQCHGDFSLLSSSNLSSWVLNFLDLLGNYCYHLLHLSVAPSPVPIPLTLSNGADLETSEIRCTQLFPLLFLLLFHPRRFSSFHVESETGRVNFLRACLQNHARIS